MTSTQEFWGGNKVRFFAISIGLSAVGITTYILWKKSRPQLKLGKPILKSTGNNDPSQLILQPDGRVQMSLRFTLNGAKWIVGHRENSFLEALVEFTKEGETLNNWTEMLTSKYSGGEATREFLCRSSAGVDLLIQNLKHRIEDVEGAWVKIIFQKPREFLVEFYEPATEEKPPSLHLHKIILSQHGLYSFFYSTRKTPFSPSERQRWISAVSQFSVVEQSEEDVPILIMDDHPENE